MLRGTVGKLARRGAENGQTLPAIASTTNFSRPELALLDTPSAMKNRNRLRPSTPFAKIPKSYAELMAMYLIAPIHNRAEADCAEEMIDLLAGHSLNGEQDDYLDLLSDVFEKWEDSQFPINLTRPGEPRRAASRARKSRRAGLKKLAREVVSVPNP